MQVTRTYESTFFEQEALRKVIELIKSEFEDLGANPAFLRLNLKHRLDDITFDITTEGFEEYLNIYSQGIRWATFSYGEFLTFRVDVTYYGIHTPKSSVAVTAKNREQINKVLRLFDTTKDKIIHEGSKPIPQKPIIFLGHGRSNHWNELKNHLQDKHGLDVIAYETGARSGHTIRDILDEMTKKASMAFLLHTAEDEQINGEFNARPNVIHETGLFQGKLGFAKAIVILEDGCQEYSNLAGIQQIRYSKGNVREIFGDVLATIRREFEPN